MTIKCFTPVGLLDIACCAAIACLMDHFLLPCFPPATCDTGYVSSSFSTQHFYMEDGYFKYMRSLVHTNQCRACLYASQQQPAIMCQPKSVQAWPCFGWAKQRRNTQIRPFLWAHGTSLKPCSGSIAPGWITAPGWGFLFLVVVWDRHGRKEAPS